MDQQELLGSIEIEGEASLSFCKGITVEQAEEIVLYANQDESVMKFTSDPKRFKDNLAFHEWLKKGRSIYTLSDISGKLAGVIWFGPKEMPYKPYTEALDRDAYGITFSIRIYGHWRGKHLARRFSEMAFADYYKSQEYLGVPNKGMWLETSADNTPAVTAYEKYGFHTVTHPDEHNKILMILQK